MVKAIVATTKLLLLRRGAQYKTLGSCCGGLYYAEEKPQLKVGNAGGTGEDHDGELRATTTRKEEVVGPVWVPHPRTGIYVPQGHERVMDDVPDSAASFPETYWLRTKTNHLIIDNPDIYY